MCGTLSWDLLGIFTQYLQSIEGAQRERHSTYDGAPADDDASVEMKT